MPKHCSKSSSKEAILKAGAENGMGVFIADPQHIDKLSKSLLTSIEDVQSQQLPEEQKRYGQH